MKKYILTALVCLSLSSLSFAQNKDISFAMQATYPPFESMNEQNEIIGFDVDIANAICEVTAATCTFTNQAFDGLIPGLKFRRFDAAISAMDVTEERKEQVLFTDTYYDNAATFITLKDKAPALSTFEGKKIGVQNGTTHQRYLEDKMPGVDIINYDTYQNALLDLKSGRVDAVFGDTAVILESVKSSPELTNVGDNITDPAYFGIGLAIAVRKGNESLVEQLNTGLQTIKDNGTYQTIVDKWFGTK